MLTDKQPHPDRVEAIVASVQGCFGDEESFRAGVEAALAADPQPSADASAVVEAIPRDIAELVLRIGRAEWGQTPAHDADGHADHIRESVKLTAEEFGQTDPQHMHGLFVEGTETVICHTGTSPNSPQIARTLTGAWNHLHDQCAALAKLDAAPDASRAGDGFTIEDRRERQANGAMHSWHEVREGGRYLCTCCEREDADRIVAALRSSPPADGEKG